MILFFNNRIGFSIAHRFAKEGAKVVISSRKQEKVNKAVELLKKENLECHGLVCHVAKEADQKKLIEEVDVHKICLFQNNTIISLYYKF
jgi:NAD(P)-dependent dehydrogenase (short-subunit alcohol dehydrogenase family)